MKTAKAQDIVLAAINDCRAQQDLEPVDWDAIAGTKTVANLRWEASQAGDYQMIAACRVLMGEPA